MDTRVIEIAISLVLIFAITSMLVTSMQEAYSSVIGLRGKVLHQAIVSFVGDDRSFAEALLDHPLLVSLSKRALFRSGKRQPSYANADTVVAALVAQLVDQYAGGRRPATPQEMLDLIVACSLPGGQAKQSTTAEPKGPSEALMRGLSALAMGAGHDWPTFEARVAAWYDSVGERSTGWFKRKTQAGVFVIGLLVAAAANINPIVIASRLWVDEPLRQAVVGAATEASKAYAAGQAASATAGPLITHDAESTKRWAALCSAADGKAADPALAQLCGTLRDLGSLRQMGLPIGWTDAAWPRLFSTADGRPGIADYVLLMPLGWLIMGLACTLGSPFWFDALGRLVRVRGAGGRTPAEAVPSGTALQPAIAGRGMLLQAPAQAPSAAPSEEGSDHDDCAAGSHAEDVSADIELPAARGGVAN